MEPAQVPQLIAQIALADPRVRREDPTERRAQIHMWAGILADVPYDAALQYATEHYRQSTWPILPAEIAGRWDAAVRDRMNRHNGTFEPTAHPELDPDDVTGYLTALREEREAVALGQAAPAEIKELTAGPAAEEVTRRLASLGSYVPQHVDELLDTHRPTKAARREAITSGQPDALTVACPVETCRATPGQPCTRPSRGHTRRRLNNPHPSRLDTARTQEGATR